MIARLSLVVLVVAGCGGAPPRTAAAPDPAARAKAAEPAVAALRAGSFEEAGALAGPVLARDRGNAPAAAARALGRYQGAMHRLFLDVTAVFEGADRRSGLDHERMRASLIAAEAALAAVDADLAVVAADPAFALELCLACWRRDWNRDGGIDEADEKLLQIELDGEGRELPEEDPRRRPTFRLDAGDAHWARAMVSFQRALLEVLLAYRWSDLDRVLFGGGAGEPRLTLRLGERARIAHARALLLAGLDAADRARVAYLAETDDDREWVPSPRQKDHPIPLPADEALYETWAGVVADLRRLVTGEEGLSVAELAQLGDHTWPRPPGGYLDFGRMLADPGDIVFEFATLDGVDARDPASVERALRGVLGRGYAETMKPSPLVGRLRRMKGEWDRGEESLERKLRYFFWLN
jgi:hypothetical protein